MGSEGLPTQAGVGKWDESREKSLKKKVFVMEVVTEKVEAKASCLLQR